MRANGDVGHSGKADLLLPRSPQPQPHPPAEKEQVLQPLEEVEEPGPAQLLAQADIPSPVEPHPVRRRGELPPLRPCRQLRHFPGQSLPSLLGKERVLLPREVPERLKSGEAVEPREVLRQLVIEPGLGLCEETPVLVGQQERPAHGGEPYQPRLEPHSREEELTARPRAAYVDGGSNYAVPCLLL